ncbi:NUDIX domain-containing protein [Micromonospora sp. WMMD714]|uniref:NAD(+) diphosphatase n=1 Tax=Micromonospora sp. WMMD714 TaxID=3016097 RepID=UPI00249A89D6|nr:NUDIX domain-containing protein [Micromonospora sp. WMMD714]WFE63978.1 NUDIX domain-containing protein [Micromonospora sp. WMMD714]
MTVPPPARPTPTTGDAGPQGASPEDVHDATGPAGPAPDDLGLVVAGTRLLTTPDGGLPRVGALPTGTGWVPLGTLDGVPAWLTETVEPGRALAPDRSAGGGTTTEVRTTAGGGEPAGNGDPAGGPRPVGRWRSWRALAAELPEPVATIAGRAVAVATWRRTHRWCGACRAALADVPGETARRCPDCGLYVPLRLSPAVLTAITRPGPAGGPTELLLVRHASGPTELWALVAGFVEAGESLETAVRREVHEEVSLDLGTIDYFGSQPWAISGPGVLLAGFTATVADPAAEPVVDGRELVRARWFPVDALPAELPPAYSISRWLIDAVAARARP